MHHKTKKNMSWVEEQSWFGLEPEDLTYDNDYCINNRIWRMKNGKYIRISDMSYEHIENCINKIVREGWRVEYLPILKSELFNRKNE